MSNTDLFKQLGLDKLSAGQQHQLASDLTEVVLNRIALRLEDKLSADQIDEITKAMKTNDDEAVKLIYDFVPGFGQLLEQETELVKNQVTNTHNNVMKKLGY